LRRGAHSDYGSLTILHQDDAPGGLQVLTADDRWEDVPHLPGAYVVNIGDMLARWTNDRWVSTVHRVVNPPRQLATSDRISIPFFHQPNHDAIVEALPSCVGPENPPRYGPVSSGEWVLRQTRRQVGAE
jgi:isopenicillin N synthase-like dioxygenase